MKTMRLPFLTLLLFAVCALVHAQTPTETTITVYPEVVGKTPALVGYGQGHYLPGSNISEWLEKSGANCLRLWVNAAHYLPAEPPKNYGDGVTDLTSFEARRAAVLADPEKNPYIDWALYDKQFRTVRAEGRNVYVLPYVLGELKRLKITPIVLTSHCAASGVTEKTDPRDWKNVRHRPAWMPISIAGNWADKWEYWKWHFASAYWMARHYDVSHFQIWNEPDHPQIGVNIRQDDYMEWLRFGSDAKRQAVRAVNDRYKKTLHIRLFGPVITSPLAFFARTNNADKRDDVTGWGEIVCRGLRTDYAGRTVEYNIVDVFDTHRYNADASRYETEIARMKEGMAKNSPGGITLPINYSEQNVESTRGFDASGNNLDMSALFCAEARILETFALHGVFGVQAFKFSNVNKKNVGYHLANEGPDDWNVTGKRRGADVIRLFARAFGGERDRLRAEASGAGGIASPALAASDAKNYYLWRVNTDREKLQALVIDLSRWTDADPTKMTVEEVSAARAGEGVPAQYAVDSSRVAGLVQPPQSVWLITIPRKATLSAFAPSNEFAAMEDTKSALWSCKHDRADWRLSLDLPSATREGGFCVVHSREPIRRQEREPLRFDFGASEVAEPGYVAVAADTGYSEARRYGWVGSPSVVLRDRGVPDALRRDFVFGTAPATFRARLAAGMYRMTVVSGDAEFGDHVLSVSVSAGKENLPTLRPRAGEFATLTATVEVKDTPLEITFSSSANNWVVNALTLEPVTAAGRAMVTMQTFPRVFVSRWQKVSEWPDPVAPYVSRFRDNAKTAPSLTPTGLTRRDYLTLIAGNVDFFRRHQNRDGAIIDPYKNMEWQYATPAFAHAAALLAAEGGRKDLVEPAAKAMDWSARTLSDRQAASAHEDFFAPMLAHALPLLTPLVAPERAARWAADIRRFDPFRTYRAGPGRGNWNVVALSGEALFHRMGLRENPDFVEASLSGQGASFASQWGLYTEGPMAYDHFPRLWAADMIAHGYTGRYAAELTEVLRRGAFTSLFLQSPQGELPAGGRSAHHQWNEAEQCVTYEIYAARALADGDREMAGVFKRAAHLSLASMKRWQRPSGELWIVKNRVDPAKGHAYEGYSSHSQYNLLAMSMLAIAHHHAGATESIAERPAPADVGGFVLAIDPELHKIVANAGGMYIEIDTAADPGYDATGLIRIHSRDGDPQIGPSDSVLAKPKYRLPDGPRVTSGVGVSWRDAKGSWRRLGEFTPSSGLARAAALSEVQESPGRVSFTVTYEGAFGGPDRIIERYVVTPEAVELTTEMPGYAGPLRYVWPVLADNGARKTRIAEEGNVVSVTLNGKTQTFTPVGASSVRVEDAPYPNHNGWARLAVAEYPEDIGKIKLRITPGK